MSAPARGLYLLHFDPPYRHAGHYLGYSGDIAARVRVHAAGGYGASPLVRAAMAAGSRVYCTRVILGGTRTVERRLKRQGGLSRHCPLCRESGQYHR